MKHKQLKGNRISTSVNMHKRTHDILKAIKLDRGDSNILTLVDHLLSTNRGKRENALRYLSVFINETLDSKFEFVQDEGWRFKAEEMIDKEYPQLPKKE